MGDVAAVITIMPEGPDTDLTHIAEKVRHVVSRHAHVRLNSIEEKPIGFGLKKLEIILVMPDSGGGTDKIEAELAEIEGVESVEPGEATLI